MTSDLETSRVNADAFREITTGPRVGEVPEGFGFLNNATILSSDPSIPTAARVISNLRRNYGEDNIFVSYLAYNEAGTLVANTVGIYKREGAELLPRPTLSQRVLMWAGRLFSEVSEA